MASLTEKLTQLQQALPDFWSDKLQNGKQLRAMLLAYSYVYADATQRLTMLENELSPFTTDAYKTEYFKVINARTTSSTSSAALNSSGHFYYELPDGTFNIDIVSKSAQFKGPLDFKILKDKTLNKTFLEIPVTSLSNTDKYLYLQTLSIDDGHMLNRYGKLFSDVIQPYTKLPGFYQEVKYKNNPKLVYLIGDRCANYLENIKAQIIGFIRCAALGGTVDSLETLFSIVLNQPYTTSDGFVVDYDYSSIYINHSGTIKKYTVEPKTRFRQKNAIIKAYEAPGVCPVKFYSWMTDPARFTQRLLCRNAAQLYSLLSLADNESPQALRFDQAYLKFDPSGNPITDFSGNPITFDFSGNPITNPITFDFGVMDKTSEAYVSSMDYSDPINHDEHDFSWWSNTTLNTGIYQFLKNVMVCELPTYSAVGGIDPTWAEAVLEFFRPLHMKYLTLIPVDHDIEPYE